MANIITFLEKEIEKSNLYVDRKGNTITPEKIETMAKKSYIQDLKSGAVHFGTTFESYHAGILSDYVPVSVVIEVMKDTVKFIQVHHVENIMEVPDPVENTENVAI